MTPKGADRLVNAVAAVHNYGSPVIVVDFGTAVTLDYVSSDRSYLGGAIAQVAGQCRGIVWQDCKASLVALEPPKGPLGVYIGIDEIWNSNWLR